MLAPRRIVSYPARSLAVAQLGYNMGNFGDDTHVALAVAGGASILRTQFSWDIAEDYATGNFSMPSSWSTFLASCAARGAKPLIVSAYGPPRQTIGVFTVSGTVAAGSPAATSIPGTYVGTAINSSAHTDFAGGSFFTSSTGIGDITARSAWYGSLITVAPGGSIQLAAALTRTLNPGDTLNIQRLRYAPPSSDTDPSIAAAVRYGVWVAQQIAAAGCTGWVDWWNEYIWGPDKWDSLGNFYDSPPGSITTTPGMAAILTQLQAATLPNGVKIVNGVTDTSGAWAAPAGSNFTHNSIHPYGSNPEEQAWDYYGWGFNPGDHQNPSGLPDHATWNPVTGTGDDGWEVLISVDGSGNFRGLGFQADVKPGGAPGVMVTESGLQTASDTTQARWNARHVLAHWGMGQPVVLYVLDDNNTPGSNTYSVAPQGTVRQSYTANQRIMAVLGRLGSTRLDTALPDVIGWNTDSWPLMATRVRGEVPGNSVLFLWQRTWANDNSWASLPSPAAQSASVYVPAGLTIAECFDVITGSTVTPTGPTSNVLTVPVADNPVAIRFSP
jgi:hypothetical protein